MMDDQAIKQPETPEEALALALEVAGGPKKLAEALNGDVSRQAISQWDKAPPHWVLRIEAATGVSRHDLRPDFYPREK